MEISKITEEYYCDNCRTVCLFNKTAHISNNDIIYTSCCTVCNLHIAHQVGQKRPNQSDLAGVFDANIGVLVVDEISVPAAKKARTELNGTVNMPQQDVVPRNQPIHAKIYAMNTNIQYLEHSISVLQTDYSTLRADYALLSEKHSILCSDVSTEKIRNDFDKKIMHKKIFSLETKMHVLEQSNSILIDYISRNVTAQIQQNNNNQAYMSPLKIIPNNECPMEQPAEVNISGGPPADCCLSSSDGQTSAKCEENKYNAVNPIWYDLDDCTLGSDVDTTGYGLFDQTFFL